MVFIQSGEMLLRFSVGKFQVATRSLLDGDGQHSEETEITILEDNVKSFQKPTGGLNSDTMLDYHPYIKNREYEIQHDKIIVDQCISK